MKINAYLIRLSFSIMIIFGGTLAIVYMKTGDLRLGEQVKPHSK